MSMLEALKGGYNFTDEEVAEMERIDQEFTEWCVALQDLLDSPHYPLGLNGPKCLSERQPGSYKWFLVEELFPVHDDTALIPTTKKRKKRKRKKK